MGEEAAAGTGTADVTLLHHPLTFSPRGICCSSARARAGRARSNVDEKRMVYDGF